MSRRWAQAPYSREQMTLLSPSIDEMIGANHEIRVFEFLLERLDWSEWESAYDENGQPPIHPRLIAGCILWGLMLRLRSSRQLEDATRNRLDFMWFLNGRTIDHATFSNFRNNFKDELKNLSKSLTLKARRMMGGSGDAVAVDGTFIKANSDRMGSKNAVELEKSLRKLGEEASELLQEMANADEQESQLKDMQARLKKLEKDKLKLEKALEAANARDDKKRKRGASTPQTAVPVTDSDATLRENKEGGFAPNHHPIAAAELDTGLVVHAEVLKDKTEAESLLDAAVKSQESLGKRPGAITADKGFASAAGFERLKAEGIKACIPVQGLEKIDAGNRLDPSRPLTEVELSKLPLRGGVFANAAFVYDPLQDCFYCPAGKRLTLLRILDHLTHNRRVPSREYGTKECATCPLRNRCTQSNRKSRSITRTEHTHLREESARYVKTDEGKSLYRRRAPVIEGVFAVIKNVMGIRQFLTRGHEKVEHEWQWICTAYNLKKLMKHLAQNGASLFLAPTALSECNSRAFFTIKKDSSTLFSKSKTLLRFPVRPAKAFYV